MNCKEHHLPELELATGQVREGLQAIIHTILFIRSPGPVIPRDVHCENFDLTYTRIDSVTPSSNSSVQNHAFPSSSTSSKSNTNHNGHMQNKQQQPQHYLDQKVDDSLTQFLSRSLTQIGPELLSGTLTLSFFERRATRQLFGLVSHTEKVIFEQWIIHVVVNNTPRPIYDDKASLIERQRLQDTSEAMLRSVLLKVLECANGVSGGGGGGEVGDNGYSDGDGGLDHIPPVMYEFEIRCRERADDRENVYSRFANMPSLLKLDG